jgi:hypothetical protein
MKRSRRLISGCSLLMLLAVACSHDGRQQTGSTSVAAAQATTETGAPPTPTPFLTLTPASTQVSFTDINGDPGQQAVTDLAALGVLDSTGGTFRPNDPIMRVDFVRWLVKADNVYFKNDPAHQIRLSHGTTSTFLDVRANNPDYPYVQGLANAGYAIGIDSVHFAPDQPLTREQMIGIKAAVDEGGAIGSGDANVLTSWLMGQFSDAASIDDEYANAIHKDYSARTTNNIERVWGTIKTFRPAQAVTRSEAAIALSEIGTGSAAVALGRTAAPKPR